MNIKKLLNIKLWSWFFFGVSTVLFIIFTSNLLNQSLWRDEAFTAITVSQNFLDIIEIMSQDSNPFLHPVLVKIIISVLGNNEYTIRLLSLTSIFASSLLIRTFFKDIFYKNLASTLFLANSIAYRQATEGRFYALLLLLTILSAITTKHLVQSFTKKNLLFWIIVHVSILYTHTLGILIVLPATIIYFFIYIKPIILNTFNKEKLKINILWQFMQKTMPILIVLLFYFPWIIIISQQVKLIQQQGFWLNFKPMHSAIETLTFFNFWPTNNSYLGKHAIFTLLLSITTILTSTIIIYQSFIKHKSKEITTWYLVIPLLLSYFLSFFRPIFFVRYLSYLLPFYIIQITRFIKNIDNKSIGIFLTIIFLIIGSWGYSIFYHPQFKHNYQVIKQYIPQDKEVINDNEFSILPCIYYYPNCLVTKEIDKLDNKIGLLLLKHLEEKKQKKYFIQPNQIKNKKEFFVLSWSSHPEENLEILQDFALIYQKKFDKLYLYYYKKYSRQ